MPKCFWVASLVTKQWEADEANFNDETFKDFIARSIIFIQTDKAVATSEWYKENRGYKAEIVTYTVSLIAEKIKQNGCEINFKNLG